MDKYVLVNLLYSPMTKQPFPYDVEWPLKAAATNALMAACGIDADEGNVFLVLLLFQHHLHCISVFFVFDWWPKHLIQNEADNPKIYSKIHVL